MDCDAGEVELVNHSDIIIHRGGNAGLLKRILIGIPVLGVASLVQFLYSVSFLGPAHLFTRHAGRGRNRRESSIDIATIIILGAVLLGTLRYVSVCTPKASVG